MRRLCWLSLLLAAAALAQTAALHIHAAHPDFEYFYKGGAWLLHHGSLDPGYDVLADGQVVARGSIEWYLPFVHRLMTLFAWLPLQPAGYLWLALNLAALFATLRLVGRHLVGLPPQDWPVTQWAPFILLALFWHWEFRLNQINNFTLLLLTASFVCWQRRQALSAGLWLGLAVLLKVTPLLLVLWFALKRQYRTALAAIVTMAVAGPVADVIVFRPAAALDAYRAWFRSAVLEGSQRGLVLSQTEMDWRNQGMGAVLSRWLHPTNYALHYDNDPRLITTAPAATINVAHLPLPAVAWLTTAIQALSLLALIWLARRPAGSLTLGQLRLEWALFVLAMLWFMPVMRAYHLIWAFPALSLLGAAMHHLGYRHRWSLAALACVLTLVPIQLLHRWLLPQAGGILLWTVALLALPLVTLLVWLRRAPAAAPGAHDAARHPATAVPLFGQAEGTALTVNHA